MNLQEHVNRVIEGQSDIDGVVGEGGIPEAEAPRMREKGWK